nr:MAG TPA: hypothetical protein [Caudoviricetes sp.]DAQ83637.1 MAG TPA: hypothetical protein [Caudoviricetes sp.]
MVKFLSLIFSIAKKKQQNLLRMMQLNAIEIFVICQKQILILEMMAYLLL